MTGSPGIERLTRRGRWRANGGTPGSTVRRLLLWLVDLESPRLERRAFISFHFSPAILFSCRSVVAVRVSESAFARYSGRNGTMSSSDRGGIQALLAAEQDAQHIVANARAAKTARLRQAKEEAEREVAQYRAQREAEFRKKLADTSGDSGANVKRLEAETDEKIKRLSADAAKVAPEVTALLMKYVITVRN